MWVASRKIGATSAISLDVFVRSPSVLIKSHHQRNIAIVFIKLFINYSHRNIVIHQQKQIKGSFFFGEKSPLSFALLAMTVSDDPSAGAAAIGRSGCWLHQLTYGHGSKPMVPYLDHEHPLTIYFDVHQGYRVLIHNYIPSSKVS